MREGLYLGAPPVNVRRGGARRLHFSLMRGLGSYSNAAGGFTAVPAMPRNLQMFRPPASANRDVRMAELYAQRRACSTSACKRNSAHRGPA
jgi:hypothetical protein